MKIHKRPMQSIRSSGTEKKKGVAQADKSERVEEVDEVDEVDRFEVSQKRRLFEQEEEEWEEEDLEGMLNEPHLAASVHWPVMLGMERLEPGLQGTLAGLLALTERE